MKDVATLAELAPRLARFGAMDAAIEVDASRIAIGAPGGSNLFCDPRTGALVLDAPRLLMPLESHGWLRARVTVAFASCFDVGALLGWVDDRRWAKLCFERTPDGRNTVVSVVNRERSDDATAFAVEASTIDLRIARIGNALAFHASLDRRCWTLVRYFEIGPLDRFQIGFTAHGSRGAGVRATFSDIAFAQRILADIRDGS